MLLKRLREENKLTQIKLGGIANVSPARISQFENSRALPCKPEAERLAIALGITVETLVEDFEGALTNEK